ncbi:hypothetical protein BDV40DRAFT_256674 [Aspergillus tamarii]|uniref:Uncharacterized protein n=1 Tax=Aspergillus tamarii TaxID=41984 RepID=A0A5N6V7Z3_ASPTM|nr:hypothetical protein BDV40DRAFT_256674 [Aspergillus tamarii]
MDVAPMSQQKQPLRIPVYMLITYRQTHQQIPAQTSWTLQSSEHAKVVVLLLYIPVTKRLAVRISKLDVGHFPELSLICERVGGRIGYVKRCGVIEQLNLRL